MKKDISCSSHSAKEQQENFQAFYKLHYPQKKDHVSPNNRFRAKSVISMSQRQNPEVGHKNEAKKKRSQLDKYSNHDQFLQKQKVQHSKLQSFSFKKMLSGKQDRAYISEYFAKYSPQSFGTVEELAKQNSGIRNALQKCKDEKVKVAKVLGSQKQTQTTKMDYLNLKKQEIEDEKITQVKQIYDQFFRKQYENLYGEAAFSEFSKRIENVVGHLHSQLFAS